MVEIFKICVIALALGILLLIAVAISEFHSAAKKYLLRRRLRNSRKVFRLYD